MTASRATLVLRNVELAVNRPTPTHILGPISLDVDLDRTLAVVGRSGAGKSSLVSILGALVPPTAGSYEIDGVRVDRLGSRGRALLRAERIGFVFQAAHLIEGRSALENVILGASLLSLARRQQVDRARAALEQVGLVAETDRDVRVLSGGERQRVAVARALVGGPRLVIADEPTGNLDSTTSDAVLDLLFGAVSTARAGLIIVTHDAAAAARADRTIELRDGVVVADTAGQVVG